MNKQDIIFYNYERIITRANARDWDFKLHHAICIYKSTLKQLWNFLPLV